MVSGALLVEENLKGRIWLEIALGVRPFGLGISWDPGY